MKKNKSVAIIVVVLLIIAIVAFFLLTNKKLNVLGKYCTVEFSGTKEKISSKTVKCGSTIDEVENPEKVGYVFLGWYDGDEEFDFEDKVDEDKVLVAKWDTEVEPDVVAVTGIYVETNSIKIKEKQVVTIKAKVEPDNATNTKLNWSSSDEKIVKVDKTGSIEGVSFGNAVITITTVDGNFKEEVKVEVEKNIADIKMSDAELNLSVGQSKELKVTTVPSDLKIEKYVWSSSNEAIVSVDQKGKITAKGVGQAEVVVKAEKEGVSASVIVNVLSPVTGVSLNTTNLSLKKGDSATLSATVFPANASNKAVTWSSSNSGVASVNGNGVVVARSAGKADIIVTTRDGGHKAIASVSVVDDKPSVIAPSEIFFDKTSYTLEYGESVKIKATIVPDNATNKIISWSSSNANVAIVDADGVVTTISPGTATIVATTVFGGKTAKATVKVLSHVVDVNLNNHQLYLKTGESETLVAKITPSMAENKKITWSSSNPNVATVDQNGKVVAVNDGKAVITVKTDDNNLIDTADVVVSKDIINVSSVSLNKSSLTLNTGATEPLVATVYPVDATDKRVVWSSSNTNVATVDQNGKVTAKGAGNATITVMSKDGSKTISASVRVNSLVVAVSGVSINKSSITLNVGDNDTLIAKVSPDNATDKGVTWASSNESVVSVDQNGKLLALSVGESIITVKTKNGGKEAKTRVVVIQPVKSLQISKRSLTLNTGQNDNLDVSITPDNATDKRVIWSSSKDSVAIVDQNGKVTAKGAGNAIITVKTYDNTISDSISVTVNDVIVPVTGISVNPTSVSIDAFTTTTLTATVSPSNATDKSVSWRTSNSSIAEVNSSGVVTGKGVGTTTITVCTADGNKCANVSVTVKKGTIKVVNITLDPTYFSIPVGGQEQISATVLPSNADNKTVTWSCNRTNVATVDQNGVVTGVGTGVATIYASSNDGSNIKKYATVNVVASSIDVQSISLNKISLDLNVNEIATLSATISPNDATNKKVSWSSSNANVATVSSSGVVTAKGVGTAIITATTNNGKTATATVNVKNVAVTSVSLSKTNISLGIGGTEAINATVLPSNATNKKVTWSSSNTSVATVSTTGVITGRAVGSATITVKTDDGGKIATATVNVTLNEIAVSSISISPSKVNLNVNSSTNLTATILPTNATNKKVKWQSNNTGVATVDQNGKVTGVSKGTAVITAISENGNKSATSTITVVQPVTSVSITPSSVSLKVGETATMAANISPSTANDKSVTWSSSNTSVATVSNSGVVTAKAVGNATITAKTTDGGKTATATVTVSTNTISVTGIVLDKSSLNLYVGDSSALQATISPSNASNKSVTWSSSNTSVVTVSNSGVVTAKAAGTATITVKTSDKGYTAKVTVTVTQLATGVIISPSTVSLNAGNSTTLNAIVSPSNAANKNLTWSSSNTNVATVSSSGVVTAKATGTAIITAKTDNNKAATAVVTVNANIINVTGVSLSDSGTIELNVGGTKTLSATVSPSNATNKNVTWTSSNTNVAIVSSSGVVTAKTAGNTRITVTTTDGNKTDYVDVKVVQPATGVAISPSTVSLNVGNTTKLTATVSPSNATNKNVTWTSSKTSVATVDANGNVKAISVGTTTITAKTNNGKTATIDVKVSEAKVNVTSVSLNSSNFTLAVGGTKTLVATVSPSNATNKSVTWTSSNTNVAIVSNGGVVTAKGVGSSTITVTTVDGAKKATVVVTVVKPVTGVKVDKTSVSLEIGKTVTLTATVSPSDATNKSVTWSSSNIKVATVDNNGKVKAVSKGSAVITVKTADGGKTATSTINVMDANVTVTLNKTDVYLSKGEKETLTTALNPTGSSTTLTWSSSNTGVATVSNGTIQAKGAGSAKVTVKTASGSTDSVTVHVPVSFTGDGYKYNSKPLDSNKTVYRGEFMGANKNRVYQSWAYDDGYIYVSERDAYITKIKASSVYNNGTFKRVATPCFYFYRGGHLSNIDIEKGKDGNKYLWVQHENCDDESMESSLGSKFKTCDNANSRIARVKINGNIFDGNGPNYTNPNGTNTGCKKITTSDSNVKLYNYNGNVAVDDVNRKIVLRTGSRTNDEYYVYDLDQFIAQGSTAKINELYHFKFKNHIPGSNTVEDEANKTGWQGMEIDNNFIYVLEGYDAKEVVNAGAKNYGIFISVYSIEGKQMVYRSNIRYPSTPSNRYWEPEGIKVINNKLYVGINSKGSDPGPKEYIYILS